MSHLQVDLLPDESDYVHRYAECIECHEETRMRSPKGKLRVRALHDIERIIDDLYGNIGNVQKSHAIVPESIFESYRRCTDSNADCYRKPEIAPHHMYESKHNHDLNY
jgi:hypothetical protein